MQIEHISAKHIPKRLQLAFDRNEFLTWLDDSQHLQLELGLTSQGQGQSQVQIQGEDRDQGDNED